MQTLSAVGVVGRISVPVGVVMVSSSVLDVVAAAMVVFVSLIIGLPAIPALIREIAFYKRHDWDMKAESGFEIWEQYVLERKLSFLPRGIIKLWYHLSRLAFMAGMTPLIMALSRQLWLWPPLH